MTSVNQHVRGLYESHVSALCIDTRAVRSVKRVEQRGGGRLQVRMLHLNTHKTAVVLTEASASLVLFHRFQTVPQ